MMRRKIQTIGWLTALLALALLWVSPAMAENYDLYIAGKQVTDANCNDLSGIEDVTMKAGGVFKYNPATKTLTMKDVTVLVGNKYAIYNRIEGLKIDISGTNRVVATENYALFCSESTELTGSGSLTVVSSHAHTSVYFHNTLTISNITLAASGKWGIGGLDGTKETLILKNAKVTATGTKAGIAELAAFITEGCKFQLPTNAKFDKTKHAVVDDEGNVAKTVMIVPIIELYIAGTQVTEANCNDLSKIPGVTVAEGGEFEYDPEKKTLTMKGVTVSAGGNKSAIWNRSIEGLKIEVSGTNSLKAKGNTALTCRTSTEIEGAGSLTTTSSNSAAIFVDGTTLTISNITLEATGEWGITGDDGDKEELIIKNAKVTAKGKEAAAIGDLKTFTLEGCQIIAPEGAKWNDEKKAVVDAAEEVAKKVKIERTVPVTGVTVTPKTVDLTVGKTQQLTISVQPATATNQRYTCQSDNESVATVTNTGLITAVSVGTANITVTTEDGNKTETCTVTVSQSTSPDNPNAVEEALFANISVAPNPFSSQLRISHKEAINVRYALLDARGTTLYQGVLEGAETTLNTENLKAGIYLLRLSGDKGATKTITVVKNR